MHHVPAIYFLAIGLLAIGILFLLMVRTNNLLKYANPTMSFTAYNNKRLNARAIMTFWKSDADRESLVRKMLWLDYAWMFVYTSTIVFGLLVCFQNAEGFWKLLYAAGIILVVTGAMLDAWQNWVLYQHLTRNIFQDYRWLTKPKTGCIVLSILVLVPGMLKNWDQIIA